MIDVETGLVHVRAHTRRRPQKRRERRKPVTGRPPIILPIKNVYDALKDSCTVKQAAQKLNVSPAYINTRIPQPHRFLKEVPRHE